jgi:squalene synthase HpnD
LSAQNSNFYWPMRLLSAPRREAAFAVYAFCRAVDDIADGDGPLESRRAALALWREKTAAIYRGEDTDSPQARAVRRFNLPQDAFDAIIDGMETDLSGPVVAPDLATLELYCTRVAGAVGRLLVRIFADDRRPDDDRFALVLGEALQLTNILRDVAEDAAVGRLYLPAEILTAAGIPSLSPGEVLRRPELPRACALLAERAEARYAEADALATLVGRRRMWPAVAMMSVYRRLLTMMSAQGRLITESKPQLSRWTAATLTLRAMIG